LCPLRVHPAASLSVQRGEWLRLLEHGAASRRAQHLELDSKQHDHRRYDPADRDLQSGTLRHEAPRTFRGSRLSRRDLQGPLDARSFNTIVLDGRALRIMPKKTQGNVVPQERVL